MSVQRLSLPSAPSTPTGRTYTVVEGSPVITATSLSPANGGSKCILERSTRSGDSPVSSVKGRMRLLKFKRTTYLQLYTSLVLTL